MEAGMKPGEFWDAGFDETLLMIKGYESRVNVHRQQTRLLAYTIVATVTKPEDRGEVYDLWWLPGDPTEKERIDAELERQEELKDAQDEAARRQKEFNDKLREELKKQKDNGR